jgi:geranylgeranyl pyrophosphate synthase
MAIQMAGGYATFPSSVPSFGCNLCLAFQVIDGILDTTQSTEVLVREC